MLVVSQGRTEAVKIWTKIGQLVGSIENSHDGFCQCDLNKRTIAIPAGSNEIQLCTIRETLEIMTEQFLRVDTKKGSIMALKLVDRSLISAYESGAICKWDLILPNKIENEYQIDCMPTCIAVNIERQEILLGTSSEKLYIFDERMVIKREIVLTNAGLNSIALRPDGKVYATGGWDRRIRVFSAKSHKKLCVLQLHDGSLNCVTFTVGQPSGLLVAASSDALISLWNIYSSV